MIGKQPNDEVWVYNKDTHMDIQGNRIPENERKYIMIEDDYKLPQLVNVTGGNLSIHSNHFIIIWVHIKFRSFKSNAVFALFLYINLEAQILLILLLLLSFTYTGYNFVYTVSTILHKFCDNFSYSGCYYMESTHRALSV